MIGGVGMVGQCRSPGMEHGGEPDAGAEVLGVGRDRDQGLGGGFEQQLINDRLVLIRDVRDRSGQGEDDMKIGYGQEFGLWRLASHSLAAAAWHFGQCRLRQELYEMRRCAQASQRSTWPPSAAVRQRSIADMTFSWPRLA